jgi:phosphoglycolate phosphatase
VLEMFDFVAGCDSGWGGKPAPGQLLAFAQHLGIDPAQAAMVGDSTHDLHAARAAGMAAVAVLTGVAEADELAPHADVVLADIGGIAAWLDQISHENDI